MRVLQAVRERENAKSQAPTSREASNFNDQAKLHTGSLEFDSCSHGPAAAGSPCRRRKRADRAARLQQILRLIVVIAFGLCNLPDGLELLWSLVVEVGSSTLSGARQQKPLYNL
jgi:hypothetical protein